MWRYIPDISARYIPETSVRYIPDTYIRYKSIISNWDKAGNEGHDMIIAMDDNLNDSHSKSYDTFKPDYTKTEKLVKLFDIRDESMIKNNLSIHNKKDTYYHINTRSKIDHIYSNCHGKINNVGTYDIGFSDHSIIIVNYNTKSNKTPPKFSFTKNKKTVKQRQLY